MTQDVGRNDPCPCGSGAKYKYCCMNTSSDASSVSSSAAPTTETESSTLSPAEQAYEAFESSDYEEQRTLVEDLIGDPERMDAENAFHMLNDLVPLAIKREDADWALDVLTRLEEEQPEVYEAELPYLLMNHLEAAAALGAVETVVTDRVETLERMATADIDQFYPCIELIAYHGSLAPIAEAMDHALEAVREDDDIMPHGKDEFCNEAVQYNLLAEYEQHGAVDLQDPDLQALLHRIDDPDWGEVDFEFLEQYAERLSAPSDQPWQIEEDPVENIDWLTLDFLRTVSEGREVPLGRLHLARQNIVECYGCRSERYSAPEMGRLLRLEQQDVRTQLNEIGSFMSSHPHRRAAFFALLPAWLSFLEDRDLLPAAAVDTTYHNLRPLRKEVAQSLRDFSSDPTLADDVTAAWA